MRYLRWGSRGSDVRELQKSLNSRGASLVPDAIFGKNTDRAVRAFQKSAGLTADGIVGPNTRAALNRGATAPKTPKSPRSPASGGTTPASGGKSVTLAHAASYKDQVLGPARYRGECAAGVQSVFNDAGKPLGLTRTWKPGTLVKGNNVPAGTAIASFKNGRYWKHAAIFIRETSTGLEVWDQWAGQPWHKRTLRFKDGNTTDGSNNGNLFYVVSR